MVKLNAKQVSEVVHNTSYRCASVKENEKSLTPFDYIKIAKDKNMSSRRNWKVKGEIRVKTENKIITLDNAKFDLLNNEQTIFFWLYNSYNYYDEKFGGKTYLDGVLCWLIAYGKAEQYGEFVKNEKAKDLEDLEVYTSPDRYEHFKFKDARSYALVKAMSDKVLHLPIVIDCVKELAKTSIEDVDYAKARYIKAVEEIALNSPSDKTKIEAYKLLGTWVGIDKPVINNNINVIMNSIDNDLKRQGFEADVSDFVIDGEVDDSYSA